MSLSRRFSVGISPTLFRDDIGSVQIVFHGINKSGSLAMANVLREAYSFARREVEFISHYHNGGLSEQFIAHVRALSVTKSFVVGHYLFGALPPSPSRVWITQFRHPLPRIVSCYQWLKNKHEKKAGGENFMSLSDFVLQSRSGRSHSQVLQLGAGWGLYGKDKSKRLTARDLYEISVEQLESSIYMIGIAERFEESIYSFAGLCGIDSVLPWTRDDRNKGRKLITELSKDENDIIREYYEYDFKLYEYALDRFDLQVNRLGIGGGEFLAYEEACKTQYKDRIIN